MVNFFLLINKNQPIQKINWSFPDFSVFLISDIFLSLFISKDIRFFLHRHHHPYRPYIFLLLTFVKNCKKPKAKPKKSRSTYGPSSITTEHLCVVMKTKWGFSRTETKKNLLRKIIIRWRKKKKSLLHHWYLCESNPKATTTKTYIVRVPPVQIISSSKWSSTSGDYHHHRYYFTFFFIRMLQFFSIQGIKFPFFFLHPISLHQGMFIAPLKISFFSLFSLIWNDPIFNTKEWFFCKVNAICVWMYLAVDDLGLQSKQPTRVTKTKPIF